MNAMLQTMRGLGGTKVIALAGIGVVLLVFFAFLSFRLATPVLSPLYTNLSQEDAGEMVVELEALGANYQVSPDGKQVLVPSGDVSRLRLALAQKGLPSHGSVVGYEIFDKTDALGTSNFVNNVNMLRALEGELSRTIASLASISSARVHLVVPKRQIFSREKILPTASVVLNLRGSQMPSREEVAAVQHLVSTAVPGLKTENITIVDNNGNLLAKGGEKEQPGMLASTTQEYKNSIENRLKKVIEDLLEKSVGFGNVRAEVSADIDFDRIVTNSEEFDPDGAVARSTQTSEVIEKSTEASDGTLVSVTENLPRDLEGAPGASPDTSSVERLDETTNYEISKKVVSHVKETGSVKKLSIAVLVDGSYTAEENEEGEITRSYQPRSDEEILQLRSLVESAVGYDPERGDTISIVNLQFTRDFDEMGENESPLEWLKRDLNSIIKTVVIGVVAILAILLVIRPLVNRAFEIAPIEEDEIENTILAGSGGAMQQFENDDEERIDVSEIQSKMSGSSSKKVTEIVDSNPEETLHVIRNWLSQKT